MNYKFVPMTKSYAITIAYSWKYEGIYSFYDITADQEDLEEFLNPDKWENTFAVLDECGKLVGFYSYTFIEDVMWLGFGLKPCLTGKGYGYNFVKAGIKFAVNHYRYRLNFVRLAVAKFNKRAVALYKKLGFQVEKEFIQETNGGQYDFVRMKKCLK